MVQMMPSDAAPLVCFPAAFMESSLPSSPISKSSRGHFPTHTTQRRNGRISRDYRGREISMALPSRTRSFSFVLLLFVSAISTAAGGVIGVAYGRDADNLIPPARVVELLKANGIGAASIYDADEGVIQAFRDSGIKLTVSLRNELLENAARDPNYAGTWVGEHVGRYFPATQIEAIRVGNEVAKQRPDLTPHLLPAMRNVYNAIKNLGYQDRIKVTTPFSFDAVAVSSPPSKGSFRSDLQPLIRQILEFLDGTGSYFTINLYPYFAYRDNPNIDLDYFLGQSRTGVQDPDTKLMYYSLLDAQTDATYSAMDALRRGAASTLNATVGASLQQRRGKKDLKGGEIGCPDCGPPTPRRNQVATAGGILNTSLAEERGCSIQNAQAHNSNLVRRIVSGKMGTPLFPDSELEVYIFSLFNENLKQGPASERSFGLFYPDGTKVYDVPWPSPGSGGSWCVANPAVGRDRMQAALDWACGRDGGADCGPIQPGAPCYEPNTVEAHASWAMNSYYQRRGRAAGTCDFRGVGQIVNQRPKIGNCDFSSSAGDSSWCVVDPGVGRDRMQAALDWACGTGGADCGPIQPGAQCYEPNTVEAHASWAVNSYYQKRGHGAGTCDFRGAGRIILQRPRYGNCELPG